MTWQASSSAFWRCRFSRSLLLTRHGAGLGERLGRLPRGRAHRPAPAVGARRLGRRGARRRAARRTSCAPGNPDAPIIVSTTSVTGRETARTRLAVDAVMLLPVDVRWIVDRVMRPVRPRCLVIVETEIWPALIRAAARQRGAVRHRQRPHLGAQRRGATRGSAG